MDSPEDLAAALPAPRDDEPATLRQDILDELRDHLACAMQRDMIAAPDVATAQTRVRNRFGDPAAIALRLYWDAMWEKIMLQRVQLGLTAIIAISLVTVSGLMWQATMQAQQSSREFVTKSQATLEKLVAANLELSKGRGVPTRNPEWNPVKVKLIPAVTGGAPAAVMAGLMPGMPGGWAGMGGMQAQPGVAGFEAVVEGVHANGSNNDLAYDLRGRSSDDGMIDMGLMRPGRYELKLTAPWKEVSSEFTFSVIPGKDVALEIACPAGPPQPRDVKFQVEWPAEWRGRDIWLVYIIGPAEAEIGGLTWTNMNLPKYELLACRMNETNQLIFGRHGVGVSMAPLFRQDGRREKVVAGAPGAAVGLPYGQEDPMVSQHQAAIRLAAISANLRETAFGNNEMRFDGFSRRIFEIEVMERIPSPVNGQPHQFIVLAAATGNVRLGSLFPIGPGGSDAPFGFNIADRDSDAGAKGNSEMAGTLSFSRGSQSTWNLPLPKPMIERVAERLAATNNAGPSDGDSETKQ